MLWEWRAFVSCEDSVLLNDSQNTLKLFLGEYSFQQYQCVHRIAARLNSLSKDIFQDEEDARPSKMENPLTKSFF